MNKSVNKGYKIWLTIFTLVFIIKASQITKEYRISKVQEAKKAEEDAKLNAERKIEHEAELKAEEEKEYNLSKELLESGKDFNSMSDKEKESIIFLVENWDKYEQTFKDKYESQKKLMEPPVLKKEMQDEQEKGDWINLQHDEKIEHWVHDHH